MYLIPRRTGFRFLELFLDQPGQLQQVFSRAIVVDAISSYDSLAGPGMGRRRRERR